jgi:type I restriction enzyme, S subunit
LDLDWQFKKVQELQNNGILLVEDGNHGEYRPRQQEFGIGEVRFIRAADMHGNSIDFKNASLINEVAFKRIIKGIGKPGDIIFSHKGTVGKLALTPIDSPAFVCSPQTTFWRTLKSDILDRKFLFYYMSSQEFVDQWFCRKGETDMADYVSLTAQRQLFLRLPEINTQRAIARILGALDDKIDLNRQMNQTLEQMAQALYKSWFVDFDPVTAKVAGKKPFGMSDEIAELFPDKFVESEMGMIPEGWRVGKLNDIAQIIDCLHSKKPEQIFEGNKILLQLNNIQDDGLLNLSEKYLISEKEYSKWISRMEAREGDCLITNVGRVGAVAQIPPGIVAALGRNMTGIRLKPEFKFPSFLIISLLSDTLREEIGLLTDAGTILNALNVKNVGRLRFILSDDKPLKVFEKKARSMRYLMETNHYENQSLSSLRDILLPRLLSGEIRLKHAEKLVYEAI